MKVSLPRILLSRFAAAALLTAGLHASAKAQTVLFDFGNDDSFRGLSVNNPDANGNYWNSFRTGTFNVDLIDVNNTPTTIDFGFSTPVATDSYNGPAGITDDSTLLIDVTFSDVDHVALGNIGGACDADAGTGTCEAVFDFVAGGPGAVRFEIQQLDPTKTYDLTFFGSHKFSTDNTTIYSVYSDNTYTTLVDTVSLDHQDSADPSSHNRDMLATISGVAPQTDDILYVEFVGDQGNEGYLNALQLVGVVPELGGDFSGDADVDGGDFVIWQRGFPGQYNAANLADWENEFGINASATSATAAVPEPGAACLAIVLSGTVLSLRRRTSK